MPGHELNDRLFAEILVSMGGLISGKMPDMKKKLILLAAFLLMSLSGCGIIAIGYNYADAYLRYSIGSYASFTDEQREIIKTDVNEYMRWHRLTMLREYIGFLQALQVRVRSGALLKQEDISRYRAQVRSLYVKTLQPAVRPAAELLAGFSAAQVDELELSFRKENKKQKDKELGGDQAEQLRKRAEKTVDFIEGLVGDFSDRQLEKMREMSYRLPYATAIYIRQKEDNQAALVTLLRDKKSVDEISAFLLAWLITPESYRTPDEQFVLNAFENASDEMIANVYQILTEHQRRSLLKNIAKYIDTFQAMTGRS